ncbi:GntR family transcriptional regulator [Alicyclobacillus tolerans]|uniref:GntR family transcriptional regulator n=1 Tax=Alicyclobacillus tolerans TaxID=90970 RepID=UPI001F23882A|nr:GntR family transcriptional regulator [Alicyclobacillus tolerans]MCF8565037.1 GntR family transcriptional regulator [Alicyclobacillus tolerans]
MSATDKAYAAIRTAIANHEFRPGYPLLETEIAERLGMSRTPVREAIHRLKAEGIVETVRRKGIFVKTLSKEEVCQTYEIAEGLEGMVSYLVASEAQDANLDDLETSIVAMEQALSENSIDKWVMADESYHAALYALCKNTYLIEDLTRLNEKLRYSRLYLVAGSSGDRTQSTQEHQATYQAIKAGNPDLARSLTQKHWARVRSEISALYANPKPWP